MNVYQHSSEASDRKVILIAWGREDIRVSMNGVFGEASGRKFMKVVLKMENSGAVKSNERVGNERPRRFYNILSCC